VSVERQQHGGYFDLQLRLKTKTEGSDPETYPNTARQPIETVEAQRFVWDGARYQAPPKR
jgi:hypothetical protein